MNASTGRLTRSIAVAITGGALVAGCGDDDEAGTTKAATPTTFAVKASAASKKKLVMEFPATVKAGLVTVTLTNADTKPRSAQILRVEGDHTVDDVLKVVNSDEQGVKIPSWMQDGGGLGPVKPGTSASATQVLVPGSYVIWDDEGGDEGPRNSKLGAKGEFTVTGAAVDAKLPAQPATVTATDEGEGKDKKYSFEFDGLKAGTNQVRFENTGDELHHALFFPIRKGVTLPQVKAAFASEGEPEGPPPVDFDSGVGTTVIDGGIAQNISLDLKAGRYAVVCFIGDRSGGEPHSAKGMLQELTVE